MSTDSQREASRRNGAKSRGPVTARGKAISSRNRYTHGILSKTIVIEGEESARFSTLLRSLQATLQPANYLEEGLVEDLAICRWRQRRLLAIETASLSREIRLQTGPAFASEPPAIRAALAINSLAAESRSFDLINRCEPRLERQSARILRTLVALRAAIKSGQNEPGI